MHRHPSGAGVAAAGLLVALLRASPAFAADPAEARSRAQAALLSIDAESAGVKAPADAFQLAGDSPERRIVAGELLLRTGDFDRAIHVLSQVEELHRRGAVSAGAHATALFFLAEAYFQDEQHLSAARHYKEIVEHGAEASHAPNVGRALARLVDVSVRTGHQDILEFVFARMGQLPAGDATGSLQYARGKAYLARGDLASAKGALASVPGTAELGPQAGYLLGVVAMREALAAVPPASPPAAGAAPPAAPAADRFAAAIEAFHRVTQLPASTDAHRHVVDLSWMAIGRLFHESRSYLDAAEAYSHVNRDSPAFGDMLYELAWVYVRLGDAARAQRALEVLSVTAPENLDMADSSLLRADLMLRAGMFARALELYETVRQEYDPMRAKVQTYLETTSDPTAYYDRLVGDQVEGRDAEVPAPVLGWVRAAAADDRVFGVIDDVTRSRALLTASNELVRKLTAVLGSPTRARAFPRARAALELATALENRVAQVRRDLALGLDSAGTAPDGSELAAARAERRAAMARLGQLPVTPGDFLRRESAGEAQWRGVSQAVQRLTVEADRLQAMVNGLRRVLGEGAAHGVTSDAASRERFRAEIEANERDLESYRARIAEYRRAVDMGRVQIGFGDQRYADDAQSRGAFRALLAREVRLSAAGQGGADLAAYASTLAPILTQADAIEDKVAGARGGIEGQVRSAGDELQQQIAGEAESLRGLADRLDALDQGARLLVGEVAMRNFGAVRDRLKGIVLRADVGIVQQAWEMREEQRHRVRDLQRERAREDQNLNDELREVLDDAGGQP